MSETLLEQIGYGRTCMHGTKIGTLGGVDLLCGMCEAGFTVWVEDPQWAMFIRFGIWDHLEWSAPGRGDQARVHWSESDSPRNAIYRILQEARRIEAIATRHGQEFPQGLVTYGVFKVADGYWAEQN